MGVLENAVDKSQLVEYRARRERLDEAEQLAEKGELEAALSLFWANLTWSERTLGGSHEATVIDQQCVAFILNQLGRYREASELNQKALSTLKHEVTEEDHAPYKRLLNIQQNLASDYTGLGKRLLAVSIYRKNYEARRQHPEFGEDHLDTIKTGEFLALSLYKIQDFVGACDLQRKILAGMIRVKAPDIDILRNRQTLSSYLVRLGRFGAAKILLEKNIEALKSRVTDAALLDSCERCLWRCLKQSEGRGSESTDGEPKNVLQNSMSGIASDIPEDPKSQFLDTGDKMTYVRRARKNLHRPPETGMGVVTTTPESPCPANTGLQLRQGTSQVSTQNRWGQAGNSPASTQYAFNTKDGPSLVNIVPAGQKNPENPKYPTAIPTINEPAADPTLWTKAKTPQPVLEKQDKSWSKPRPRSVSPGPGSSARESVSTSEWRPL